MNSAFRFEPPHDNSRLVDYYRPIFWITPLKAAGEKGYSLSVGFLFQEEGAPLPAAILAGQRRRAEPRYTTILFIPLSAPPHKLETDWATSCAEVILRRCPACESDSIIGHGRRRKQAHDEHHDWIGIRRGRCPGCGKTFTFLPCFSLPYTQYSLLTRCQAMRRRFMEHCSWEEATPTLKDANRVPDSSTLRRWSSGLDRSQPAVPRQNLEAHLKSTRCKRTCITCYMGPAGAVMGQDEVFGRHRTSGFVTIFTFARIILSG